MSPPDLRTIADEMKAAQDECRSITPFTSRFPGFDLPAAYEVLHRVHAARLEEGARPAGRKIGFTNSALWPVYGVSEPIWGFVYDTTLGPLGVADAECALGSLADPKIEPEIVFRLRKAPGEGASLEEILDAIDWVACGFEIVQSHFPGWKFKAPDTVADGSLHGRLFVGEPRPLSELGRDPLATLETFTVSLSCDGRPVEDGRGSNVLGSPLKAVRHLLAVLADQGNRAPLEAGEIVTTGTLTMAHPIRPGQTWTSRVEGIGLAGLTLRCAD